jgi:hypothetical protein
MAQNKVKLQWKQKLINEPELIKMLNVYFKHAAFFVNAEISNLHYQAYIRLTHLIFT